MATITIPKKEYEDIFALPPTHSTEKVVAAFKISKKYSSKFLKSLANGLKQSSYFK